MLSPIDIFRKATLKSSACSDLIIFQLFFLSLSSCEYNKLPEPEPPEICDTVLVTYTESMMDIINSSCAYSGCHDGAGGIGPFDFTTYEGLTNVFDDLRLRVIDLRDDPAQGMPPNSSVYPQSKKDDLTEEELALFECWIASDFPEQ